MESFVERGEESERLAMIWPEAPAMSVSRSNRKREESGGKKKAETMSN